MKRQSSPQEGVPKRHCPVQQQPQPQLGLEMRTNQHQVAQFVASPSNRPQSQGFQAPQQPVQHQQNGYFQHAYHENVNGNPFMPANITASTFDVPPQVPQAHFTSARFAPNQFPQEGFTQALANHGMMAHRSVNQAMGNHVPINYGLFPQTPMSAQTNIAQFGSLTFNPIQPTGFGMTTDPMGFPANNIPQTTFNRSWPPPRNQLSQHVPTGYYPCPQQQTQLEMNRQPQRVVSAPVQSAVLDSTTNIRNGLACNGTPLPVRGTPRLSNGDQVPLPARRPSINHVNGTRRHIPKDHQNIDLAELSRPSTSKPPTPDPRPKATPIPPPIAQPSPAVPNIAAPIIAAPIIAAHDTPVATPPYVLSSLESLSSGEPTPLPSSEASGMAQPIVSADPEPSEQLDLASPVPAPAMDLQGLEPVQEFLHMLQLEQAGAAEANAMQNGNGSGQPMAEAIGAFDMTAYPAQSHDIIRPPGCQFRAAAICIGGRITYERNARGGQVKKRWIAYGVRRPGVDGGIEFKLAEPNSSVEEILRAREVQLSDVQLNANFADMSPQKIVQWVGYLLAAVPGITDDITTWAPARQSN